MENGAGISRMIGSKPCNKLRQKQKQTGSKDEQRIMVDIVNAGTSDKTQFSACGKARPREVLFRPMFIGGPVGYFMTEFLTILKWQH